MILKAGMKFVCIAEDWRGAEIGEVYILKNGEDTPNMLKISTKKYKSAYLYKDQKLYEDDFFRSFRIVNLDIFNELGD